MGSKQAPITNKFSAVVATDKETENLHTFDKSPRICLFYQINWKLITSLTNNFPIILSLMECHVERSFFHLKHPSQFYL